jgi:hypothetical protein
VPPSSALPCAPALPCVGARSSRAHAARGLTAAFRPARSSHARDDQRRARCLPFDALRHSYRARPLPVVRVLTPDARTSLFFTPPRHPALFTPSHKEIMNTQLMQDRRNPAVTTQVVTRVVRRSRPPNPLDRLALRIGLALIIWGRRGTTEPDRAHVIRRRAGSIAREAREREYQRSWFLIGPRQ